MTKIGQMRADNFVHIDFFFYFFSKEERNKERDCMGGRLSRNDPDEQNSLICLRYAQITKY